MHWKLFRPLLLIAISPAALAQVPAAAQDSRAGAPATSGSAYQSAFADYKPYTEPVVMSWREANDQVSRTGGMQGHDMATMKSSSDDPHAGHDMSKMGANPTSPSSAGSGISTSAAEAAGNHGAHGVQKTQADDPHAGHDMSKMDAPPRKDVPVATDKANNGAHGTPAVKQPKKKRERE